MKAKKLFGLIAVSFLLISLSSFVASATIDNTNWKYEKPIEGDSQATALGSAKVQPVILDGSLSETNTGNGNIGYDTSRIDTTDTQSKLESIVFTEPDGETTKPYE